ncbi:MAG: hypothetical protein AABX01_07350 [Candidatus Micrarchaeota archaeon]
MRKPIHVRNLDEIKQIIHSGEQGHGHGHAHTGEPYMTHQIEGLSPYNADNLRPWSTQHQTHLPEEEGKRLLPMYMPMTANDTQGDGKGVNSMMVKTRLEIMNDMFDENYKNGAPGAVYRAYFMAWLCFAIMLFALTINVYLAGLFAYLVGYYWSEKELARTWSVDWWKSKALISTN